MYKSIVQFIENETPKIEKFIKKFIKGEKDIDEISYFLSEKTNGMIKNIITEV
jgi:flagellar motor switch protein FliG